MQGFLERFGFFADMAAVRRTLGKGYLSQVADLVRIKMMRTTLGISDYFWYRLYDPEVWESEGPKKFAGWRIQQAISKSLNPRNVVLPAWDKITFTIMSRAHGLPVPALQAIYVPKGCSAPDLGVPVLGSKESLARFLDEHARFPMFAKPSYCQQGKLGVRLEDYNPRDKTLTLHDGHKTTVSDFFDSYIENKTNPRYYRPECGYLFQDLVRQHPDVTEITGSHVVSGFRIVLVQSEDGLATVAAVWKIVKPTNATDNFNMGRYGNLLAGIDVETGRFLFAVDGAGPKANRVDTHPETGRQITGSPVPCWQDLIRVCKKAASAFPLIRLQHWDVALSRNGPILLELNDLGTTEYLQYHGRGLLTDDLRAALRRFADAKAHPWLRQL